jgi:protein SCO1/2/putative membrane protein
LSRRGAPRPEPPRAVRARARSPFAFAPFLLALASAALVPAACERPPARSGGGLSLAAPADSPAAFGTVADFALTRSDGRAVTLADLAGTTWVCDFFFTTCTGPCPKMSAAMEELQAELAGSDVHLVSITVDPARDTPEVLRGYAGTYGADPARWWFLTGDEPAIYDLCRTSFALPVARADERDAVLGMQVAHATRLVAIDGAGQIRGYYDIDGEDVVRRVAERARFLERERGADPASGGDAPRTASRLPLVNATLNGTAAVLLVLGLAAIKSGRRELHGWIMRAAFLVSAAFLASYLWYHFVVIAETGPTRFRHEGWPKTAYLALLASHVVLAVVNLPMVLRTLWLAHRERWPAHRRLARWTFPLWMYVSVTGVLVYLCLYVW